MGVPDPRLGETQLPLRDPALWHRAHPSGGGGISSPDSVATYKLPEAIEIFDEFPFTPTGKIQRHALTRQVLARRR